MGREKPNDSGEKQEVQFYFYKRKMISQAWGYAFIYCMTLFMVFYISLIFAYRMKNDIGFSICCFCAGMLLHTPVEFIRAVWRSKTCLRYIMFTDSRIILNRDVFSKEQIRSIERKGRYIIIKSEKRYFYWLGMKQSIPEMVERRVNFQIQLNLGDVADER